MPAGGQRRFDWDRLPRRELLALRLSDLGLTIEGSWLERPIARVREELWARGLSLRPHFWLSDEWFSPDGIPGVALPFYLAHPRLIRLERAQMLEVEGASLKDCLRLLRHEIGHAVQHGYELHRLRRWQNTFGKSSKPYPDYYRPNPASKRYVQHLAAWYAQSHPDEDFAETFAVWLAPRSDWRRRYAKWPALRKLEYVDELMGELAGRGPRVRSRATPDALPRLRRTLAAYYADKHERYSGSYGKDFDHDLGRVFSSDPAHATRPSAAAFLRRHRSEIVERVARATGEYRFTLDQVLKEMIGRSRELGLRAAAPQRQITLDFAILLTAHTMQRLYRKRYWHPL